MPLSSDLINVGVPAAQAVRLGNSASAAVTAAGTTTTDATVLTKWQDFVNMTASGSDGIRLPSDAELFHPYTVYNSSGSTGKIYPPTSGTLNGGTATTGSVSLTTLKVITFWRYSSTGWAYNLTA